MKKIFPRAGAGERLAIGILEITVEGRISMVEKSSCLECPLKAASEDTYRSAVAYA